MEYPQRKHPRLKTLNYNEPGFYFITICTKNRKNILAQIVAPGDIFSTPTASLTDYGEIADRYIRNINHIYDDVKVDKYVIMPNHIHMIIALSMSYGKINEHSVPTIVRSFKRMTIREIGEGIWQDSYYDHIIRNDASYREIWQYIDENPQKWLLDRYYCSD